MYVQLCIYYIGLENYSNAILVVLQFIFVDIHMGCFTTVFSPGLIADESVLQNR